jgi:hypothetical protein
MAEIRIPVEKLPPPDKNGDHAFQFRIISVDKNQWSAWSQLYVVKSIGQYRPKLSPVSAFIANNVLTVNWNSPLVYNAFASLPSASIQHTRSLSDKFLDTDVFVQFSSGSVMTNFGYLSTVSDDAVEILIPSTSASVRVVGTVATKKIPQPFAQEASATYQERFDDYVGVSASVQGVFDLFRVFDTGVAAVPVSASVATPIGVSDPDQVAGFGIQSWTG